MGNWLENAYSSFWHEATKDAVIKTAARICVDLDFMPNLKLSEDQLDLFHANLAACIVLQEGRKDAYLARRPEVNLARGIPIIGAVINALVFIPNQVNTQVESELAEKVQAKRLKLVHRARDLIISSVFGDETALGQALLGQRYISSLGRVVEEIAGEKIDLMLKPRLIRLAANLMASTYVSHKTEPREKLIAAMKQTEKSIASWNDWGQKDEN